MANLLQFPNAPKDFEYLDNILTELFDNYSMQDVILRMFIKAKSLKDADLLLPSFNKILLDIDR